MKHRSSGLSGRLWIWRQCTSAFASTADGWANGTAQLKPLAEQMVTKLSRLRLPRVIRQHHPTHLTCATQNNARTAMY